MPLAYIDPGAGSLVIQALIAAVVSVPFFLRSQLRAVVSRLRRDRASERSLAVQAPEDEGTPAPRG